MEKPQRSGRTFYVCARLHAVLWEEKTFSHELDPKRTFWLVMHGWNCLFFAPATFKPDPQKSEAWNRGAYLVEGAAHCGACHTPKTAFGAERRDRSYGGGLIDGWFAPRLDNAPPSGLRSWSADELVEYL